MNSETIAAIATAMSNSGIGIIRVSGNEAIQVVDRIYCNSSYEQTLKKYKTHTIHYGYIFRPCEESFIDKKDNEFNITIITKIPVNSLIYFL